MKNEFLFPENTQHRIAYLAKPNLYRST